jgi:hypothetical protein
MKRVMSNRIRLTVIGAALAFYAAPAAAQIDLARDVMQAGADAFIAAAFDSIRGR